MKFLDMKFDLTMEVNLHSTKLTETEIDCYRIEAEKFYLELSENIERLIREMRSRDKRLGQISYKEKIL